MYLSPFAYRSLQQCILLPKPANYCTIWGLQSVIITKSLHRQLYFSSTFISLQIDNDAGAMTSTANKRNKAINCCSKITT